VRGTIRGATVARNADTAQTGGEVSSGGEGRMQRCGSAMGATATRRILPRGDGRDGLRTQEVALALLHAGASDVSEVVLAHQPFHRRD
jgi:hypothetical protein